VFVDIQRRYVGTVQRDGQGRSFNLTAEAESPEQTGRDTGRSAGACLEIKNAGGRWIWGLPTYYVIDQMGKVSYIHVLLHVDSVALGQRLREAIETALRKERDQPQRTSSLSTVKKL
jgi:hypothetical protein